MSLSIVEGGRGMWTNSLQVSNDHAFPKYTSEVLNEIIWIDDDWPDGELVVTLPHTPKLVDSILTLTLNKICVINILVCLGVI